MSINPVWQETFDFLGYTIGRCYSPQTGRSYIGTRPSAKKVASLRDEIRELTDRRWQGTSAEDRVGRLNRLLLGWSNYFCLGPVTPVYRAVDWHCCYRRRQWLHWHCCYRLLQWLRRKHKVKGRGKTRFSGESLHGVLGLVDLGARTRHFA